MGVSMLFLQLIPVRKIGLIIQGFSYIVFATDIQPITVRKIITFITESCFPEAYCHHHHKCPMGCELIYTKATKIIDNECIFCQSY